MRYLYFFLFIISFSFYSQAENKEPYVKVAIGKVDLPITIKTKVFCAQSKNTHLDPTRTNAVIALSKNGFTINGTELNADRFVIHSANTLWLNGKGYRHKLIFYKQPNESKALVVHPVALEKYIAATVSSEMSASFPKEALKAQAIASRTYALWQKNRRHKNLFHLDATYMDQVFNGAKSINAPSAQATEETRGMILTYQGKEAQTFFHSICGGHTESSQEGFGEAISYLKGYTCGYCDKAKGLAWKADFDKANLQKLLAPYAQGTIEKIAIKSKTKTGRVKEANIVGTKGTSTIKGATFRSSLGYNKVRSRLIDKLIFDSSGLHVSGHGYGHGVGMCQWGANFMAKDGKNSKQILYRYYPGTKIEKIY